MRYTSTHGGVGDTVEQVLTVVGTVPPGTLPNGETTASADSMITLIPIGGTPYTHSPGSSTPTTSGTPTTTTNTSTSTNSTISTNITSTNALHFLDYGRDYSFSFG